MDGDAAVLSDTVPVDVTVAAASAGVAVEVARQDHKHDIAVKLNELDAPTAAVALNSQKITGLAAGTVAGDAVALDVNLRAPDSTLLEGSTKAQIQDHVPQAHLLGSHTTDTLVNLNAKVTDATLDDSSDPRTPNVHKTSHEDGGADEISVAALSGLLADGQTPLTHAGSHKSAGADEIDLDELGAPTGNVDFNQKQAAAMAFEVLASAPETPVDGQVYFSSVDDHPYVYVPA